MKKGISLITLIITIIVVVILAGAVILNMQDTNVIKNAELAVSLSDLKVEMVALDLFHSEQMLERKGDYHKNLLMVDGDGNLTYKGESVDKKDGSGQYNITDIFQSNEITVFSGQIAAKDPNSELAELIEEIIPDVIAPVITLEDTEVYVIEGKTFTDSGVTVADNRDSSVSLVITGDTVNTSVVNAEYTLIYDAIDSAGNEAITKTKKVIIVDASILITDYKERTETLDGSSTTGSFDNPVIPKGFKAVNATGVNENTDIIANWNFVDTDYKKGLVIEDGDGNQYVWIPVDGGVGVGGTTTAGTVTYNKFDSYHRGYDWDEVSDHTLPIMGVEIDQINTYKGFYVGRFEAGISGDTSANTVNHNTTKIADNLVSKPGVASWNWISYPQAKTLAESKYTNTTYSVQSGLITGTMWDAVQDFIDEYSGKDIMYCSYWGNYDGSKSPANVAGYGDLQVTGYSDFWSACNIYDFAGNTYEWNSEHYSSNYYITRSGCYADYYGNAGYTNSKVAGVRIAKTDNTLSDTISFRIALYIM